jgi:tetratricopeptide (TPR) repeat protein
MTMTANARSRKTGFAFLLAAFMAACVSPQARLAAQQEKSPQYQYEKAVVCMQAGLHDEAIKYLTRAVSLDPKHYLSHNLFGLIYMLKREFPLAQAEFDRCVAIKPDFSEAYNNLGTVLQETGQTAKAEAAFKRAFEIDQNYNASYNLAKISYERGQLEPALGYIGQSLEKFDRSLLAWNLQGLILDTMGRTDEAIVSYQQALKRVPNEENVSFNLAVAYFRKGDKARAREICDRILPKVKTEELRSRIRGLLDKLK